VTVVRSEKVSTATGVTKKGKRLEARRSVSAKRERLGVVFYNSGQKIN